MTTAQDIVNDCFESVDVTDWHAIERFLLESVDGAYLPFKSEDPFADHEERQELRREVMRLGSERFDLENEEEEFVVRVQVIKVYDVRVSARNSDEAIEKVYNMQTVDIYEDGEFIDAELDNAEIWD